MKTNKIMFRIVASQNKKVGLLLEAFGKEIKTKYGQPSVIVAEFDLPEMASDILKSLNRGKRQ